MLRIFVKFFISIINFINFFFENLFNINFKGFLTDRLRQNYKSIFIKNTKTNFFIPSHIAKWRVDTFFEKEPETLEWIDKFKVAKDSIFWDVGSNIGLYSIYASRIHKKIKVYSFEPSFLNLNVLARNIYINNLKKNISIFQLPLASKSTSFQYMMETSSSEGGALSSFGSNKDFRGKKIKDVSSYSILGTTLDEMVKKKILDIPDYIKIDVDGIEHLILSGFSKNLKNKKIKSILIEVNENFINQMLEIKKILKKNNYVLKQKKQSELSKEGKDADKIFNYIYFRK
jgi:FkbM family methyltransferase